MKGISLVLHRWLLSRFSSRLCESKIPRSGEEGESVNCFVIALDKNNKPYQVITKIADDNLFVKEWDGNSYAIEKEIRLESIEKEYLYITHYYGLSTIKYFGLGDYLLNGLSGEEYFKIHVVRFLTKIDQYFFNQKKLVTKQRIELLRLLIKHHIDSGGKGIGLTELMTRLYSIKWVLHPDSETQQNKVELYLDSLAESGEVKKSGIEYFITGNAIATIEKYEEEERRHFDNVRLQKKAMWLTAIIAFFALIQAGVIKLPTVIDWSNGQVADEKSHNRVDRN